MNTSLRVQPAPTSSPAEGRALARSSTSVTLAVGVAAEAQALGSNFSQAVDLSISATVAPQPPEQWLADSRNALDSSNTFVEQHGLPLASYRNF